MRIVHIWNKEKQTKDRLPKNSTLAMVLKQILQKYLSPYQNLCIDESLLLFKGWLIFKQFIASKQSRFEIKMSVISDCKTAYILDFIIYSGQPLK